MKVITRVAPSITGKMHLGTLFNALVNYVFAKQNNGVCFLRLDGQHLTPSRIRFQEELIGDLKAFGFTFDFIVKQSDRTNLYKKKIKELVRHEDTYFCDCSKESITARSNNNPTMYSLERAEKYPVPCGIKQVLIYDHERKFDLVQDALTRASAEARGFPASSITNDKSSCWKPFDIGYFGTIEPYIQFEWSKPTRIQCIQINWQNYPLRRYQVFADKRMVADIRKIESYCYTGIPSHYGDNFKDEISFAPVKCTSLLIKPIEYMKEVKIEYYYDQHCRDRILELNLDNKTTVVRKRCDNFLDVALYFDKQPDLCLTSAIDDKEFGVTHSIRGIDIEPFTKLEREAGSLIGYTANNLFHGMVLNENYYKLSKAINSKPAVDYLKDTKPDRITSGLAQQTGLVTDQKIRTLPQMVKDISLDRVFI